MIYRCEHKSSVNIDTALILNKKLSAEARLLLVILLSHEDDHRFNFDEIVEESGMSKYKVSKALNELKLNNYLNYKHISTAAGRFDGVEWIVNENPNGTPSVKSNSPVTPDEQPEVISTAELNFNRIWQEYPAHRRGDKKEAIKVYKRIPEADDIIEDILRGLREMKCKTDWQKEQGKWIPGLRKFLENRIWEEGLDHPSTMQGRYERTMEVLKNAGY